MKSRCLICSLLVMAIISCSSSKTVITEAQIKTLDSMMRKPKFSITSNWAQPQVTNAMNQLANTGLMPRGSSIGNIDISGIPNFLNIKQDSIKAKLPFFGERHFGGGYTNSEGIEFEGHPRDLQTKKGKNSQYNLQFSIRDTNSPAEVYQVHITIWPNLNSDITITSNQRNAMQYQGKVQVLD